MHTADVRKIRMTVFIFLKFRKWRIVDAYVKRVKGKHFWKSIVTLSPMAHPIDVYGKAWISKLPVELICWVSALTLLYFSNPHAHHFTLCPLENAGFDWCPGCGLGRSIALLMHGELEASLGMHWLGIPAFLVIIHRIYTLSKREYYIWTKHNRHEQP